MNAVALQALDDREPQTLAPRKAERTSEEFHGELKRAAKKDERPKAADKSRRAKRDAVELEPGAQPSAIGDGKKPTAVAFVADDLSAMISAGRSLVAATGTVGIADSQVIADAAVDEAPALEAMPGVSNASDALAMSPLEQAVHDLIDRLRVASDKGQTHDADTTGQDAPVLSPLPGTSMVAVQLDDQRKELEPMVPVREATPAEQAANPSHVHLVIDDGERLVVTVAVRGDQVLTHIRGDNEATTAALARNAGVLDDAMRARGLTLAELQTSHHDHGQRDPQARQHTREQREQAEPAFTLEGNR